MGKDATKVFKLGPASITVNGTNIGFTGPDGVRFMYEDHVTYSTVADYGDTNFKAYFTGCALTVETQIAQTELDILSICASGATEITDGSDSAMGLGKKAGTEITGVPIVISPVDTNMPSFTMYKGIPEISMEAAYTGEDGTTYYPLKFVAVVDSSKTSDVLGRFGDTSINADVTAPTVSSVVPADEATSVAVSTNVIWTMSEELELATVTTKTVGVIKISDQSNVAGAVTLVNNGASTTITFNPTSDLDASSDYIAYLTKGIEDLAGNNLAAFSSTEFQTA